ncbi:hypothetical protein [Cupriavidus metallidurans]|nr:hypothetical protein [Cupriavidus metallidurans]
MSQPADLRQILGNLRADLTAQALFAMRQTLAIGDRRIFIH